MEPTINELPGSKVELKFTVTPEEVKPYLDVVVEEVGKEKTIPGFRPGKAPKEEIIKVLGGEMQLWQLALERIVRTWFVKTVLDKGYETIGSPEIAVDQLTPGQDVKFTCTVAIMPTIRKAHEVAEPFVKMDVKDVKDEEVEKAIEELRAMRRKEVASIKPSQKEGMVLVDMEMKKDGVLLEGGQAKDYKIYLNENHYIPKLAEQLLGVNKGDKKTFTLPFPADHFEKLYAGKDIDFEVDVKEVYEIQLPEVNDEFTKSLGIETVEALKDVLRQNMKSENERRALEVAEIELLETLVEKSSFTEVPEILLKEETRRMFEEMRHDIEQRGGKMEDYLTSIKKSADEFKIDMLPTAEKRVKTAVYVKHIAKENDLTVSDEELDMEIDKVLEQAKDQDQEVKDRITSPEYREYVQAMMRNRKTLEFLKEKGIKEYKTWLEKFAKEEAEHAAKHGGHVHGPDCNH
ncbi:MAG: trigger factor [Patescibacteria group bacterium]|nr:trigger factor [Patescibacteria group bacterium]